MAGVLWSAAPIVEDLSRPAASTASSVDTAPSIATRHGDPERSSWGIQAAITAVGVLALVAHAARFYPFIADDALISLRYAKRFLAGAGLTWTDGPPVEGYSNLLWILLTSLLGFLGFDLIDAVRILGIACTAIAIGALVWRYTGPGWIGAIPAVFGSATLVLAAPIAVWSIGGLEQPLIAAGLAVAMALLLPHLGDEAPPARVILCASLCLAALCWTRPDAPLFTALVCGMWVLLGRFQVQAFRTALQLAALPILFVLAQLAFRLMYYDDYVPNTARVKISPSWPHFVHGAGYLWRGLLSLSPISEWAIVAALLAFVPAVRSDPQHRRRVAFILAPALTWALYVVAVSGDIFPAFRHLIPLIVLFGFLIAETSRFWIGRSRHSRAALSLLVIFGVAAFSGYLAGQWNHRQTRRAIAERFEWEGKVVGLAFKRGFGEQQPLMAVTSAGTLPYWSELPALDMLGLNDRYLAHNPPPNFGQGGLGHELGDADYVLRRKPDLLLYHIGLLRSRLRAGKELHERPEFHAQYMPIRFMANDPAPQRFDAWIRRDSEKIGIRRRDGDVYVPGYLFNGNLQTLVSLDAEDRFMVPVTFKQPAAHLGLALPPGRWSVTVDAAGATSFEVTASGSNSTRVEDLGSGMVLLNSEADQIQVDLRVRVEPFKSAELRGVTLRRAEN